VQINDRTVWTGTVKDKERIFEEESVSELSVWVLVASFCWLLCHLYARVKSLSRDVWLSNNINKLLCFILSMTDEQFLLFPPPTPETSFGVLN